MITDTVCSVGVFAWMRGSFPCPPRHALVSKNRACAEGETHTTYTDTDTHTHTSGLTLGEKDGSARGGGDSASGGNSNTGTSKDPRVEELTTFDPREMRRDHQGRSRDGDFAAMRVQEGKVQNRCLGARRVSFADYPSSPD